VHGSGASTKESNGLENVTVSGFVAASSSKKLINETKPESSTNNISKNRNKEGS
jgi:hypothetical protein